MTPTEVLKMLKSKIDAAGLNKYNYAIETSDIEAINQALLLYDVSGSLPTKYGDLLNAAKKAYVAIRHEKNPSNTQLEAYFDIEKAVKAIEGNDR